MPVSRPRRFFGSFCIAAKGTRRRSGETFFFRIFRRLRTATYFARGGKVGKTPLGRMAFGKDLRLTPWSFRCRFPPDPLLRETGVPSFGLAVAAGAVPS